MAVYSYKAMDVDATDVSGVIAADTPRAARDELRQRRLTVQQIEEVRQAPKQIRWRLGRRVRGAEVTDFARELSILLAVGIPLLDALDTLLRQYRGRFRAALLALRERLAAGLSLHEAMKDRPDLFDAMCVSLAEVGDNTGTLESALSRLADYRERAQVTRNRIVNALIYPAIVSTVGLIVVVFLMTYVVPQLMGTLVQAGRPLPVPTRIVKAVSDLLVTWWWAIGLGLGGLVVGGRLLLRTRRGREAWDRLTLRLPLVGSLVRKEWISRISVVLAALLRSGVPFDESLRVTGRAVRNSAFRNALGRCERAIQAGSDLSSPLSESKIFPPSVIQIIAVGQQSGELEAMLERLAVNYDQQVATATSRLTSAMEPLIIVLLAVAVGFVAFATILPILEASNVL